MGAENLKQSNEQNIHIEKKENQEIPNQEILQSYEKYELFKSVLNQSPNKQKVVEILQNIDSDELEMYLDGECDGYNLIDEEAINNFIENFKEYLQENNISNIQTETKNITNNILLNNNIKSETTQEKSETTQEKSETTQEKSETTQEKSETTQEKSEKQKEGKKYIVEKIDIIKSIDEDFYNEISELLSTNNSIEQDQELVEKIVSYFKKGDNAKKFFDKLAEKNPKEYNQIYQALANISPEIKTILEDKGINTNLVLEEKIEVSNTDKISKYKDLFKDKSKIKVEGSIISSGDKYIDTSKKPPVGYITLKNGLKIETKISTPHFMEERAEFSKKKIEFQKNINNHKEKIKGLKNEILDIKNNIKGLNKKIETIKNSNIPENEKTTYIRNIETLKTKNTQLIKIKEHLINEEEATINALTIKFKKTKEKFEQTIRELKENYSKQLLEGDEKARKTLQFLDSIGIDGTLMGPLEQIIKQLNHNSALRNKLGFDRKINLANNDLGINNDLGNDGEGINSIKVKERFASIINILLTGTKTRPININSLSTGTTFTNDNGEIRGKYNAIGAIKEKMGINIYSKMLENAINYDSSKEK